MRFCCGMCSVASAPKPVDDAVVRVRVVGERVDDLAGLGDLVLRFGGQLDLGALPRDVDDVFEGGRVGAELDRGWLEHACQWTTAGAVSHLSAACCVSDLRRFNGVTRPSPGCQIRVVCVWSSSDLGWAHLTTCGTRPGYGRVRGWLRRCALRWEGHRRTETVLFGRRREHAGVSRRTPRREIAGFRRDICPAAGWRDCRSRRRAIRRPRHQSSALQSRGSAVRTAGARPHTVGATVSDPRHA